MSGKKFRALLQSERPLILPGAYDALSARLIQRAGFKAYVIGGFSLVGSRYALPDLGIAGLGEISAGVRDILPASSLPVLVDADNGYGDIKTAVHTLHTYERMGVSALQFEDQRWPKRCGHMTGKQVVSSSEMERLLSALSRNRLHPETLIMARTDARAVEGLDATLRRAERYLKAGADGLFVEAPESLDELALIGRSFDVPQAANMLEGGKTPLLPPDELADMGFSIVYYGISLVLRVTKTIQQALVEMQSGLPPDADAGVSFTAYQQVVDRDRWAKLESD